MQRIILASNSPRRRQLMSEAGYHFTAINTSFDEIIPEGLIPHEIAIHLAQSKNNHYRDRFKDEILITSDTIVVKDHAIFGKPKNEQEATEMLEKLSGSEHIVISGLCISDHTQHHSCYDTTKVFFEEMSKKEISYYVKKHLPLDKAGSYGIQDWIGLTRIKKIEGSYFNVMGLPVNMVYRILKDHFSITPFD